MTPGEKMGYYKNRYAGLIRSAIGHITNFRRDDVDDMVQDVCLRAATTASVCKRGDNECVERQWLIRIAQNMARDKCSNKTYCETTPGYEYLLRHSGVEEWENIAIDRMLGETAIQNMTPNQAWVVMGTKYLGYGEQELADMKNLSRGSISNSISRGKRRGRLALKNYEPAV